MRITWFSFSHLLPTSCRAMQSLRTASCIWPFPDPWNHRRCCYSVAQLEHIWIDLQLSKKIILYWISKDYRFNSCLGSTQFSMIYFRKLWLGHPSTSGWTRTWMDLTFTWFQSQIANCEAPIQHLSLDDYSYGMWCGFKTGLEQYDYDFRVKFSDPMWGEVSRSLALSAIEAWAESEVPVHRSFISYCMDRFQRNPKSRSGVLVVWEKIPPAVIIGSPLGCTYSSPMIFSNTMNFIGNIITTWVLFGEEWVITITNIIIL